MIQKNYDIDIIHKLDKLIEEQLLNYDLIVPIARRGVRTLELSTQASSLFNSEKILFYDSIWFHKKNLKGKKIVLFDESVRTGNSLALNKSDLEIFLRTKGVKTSALLVHRDDVEIFPNHYLDELICNENLYERLSDELIARILSDGKPLDIHHPIFLMEIPQENASEFYQTLKEIYKNAIELEDSNCFGGTRLFTIDFKDDFKIPYIDSYPILLDDGPKKIRLFMKGNIIRCVPIVFPCIDISEETLKRRELCILKKHLSDQALCGILNSKKAVEKDYKLQSQLCYTCIVNELNCRLVGQFFKSLRDNFIPFIFQGLDEIPMKATYYNEGKQLTNVFIKKIESYIKGDIILPLGSGIAKKCILPEVQPANRDYLLKIRPEMEVSLGISLNNKINESLFLKEKYKPLKEPLRGLSYMQVNSLMHNMGESNFSQGMDIGLDVGYLKPFNTAEGITVEQETGESLRVNMRLYTTSSEHVRDSLKIFAKFIIPKTNPNE